MKWNCYRIGDVFSRFSSGKNITESRISDNDSFPVYGGNGVRGFTDSYNFDGECILIGRQGAKCGNVRYFKGKAYMSDHAIVGVSKNEHCARFLHVALSCLQLNRLSGQAAQPGLSVNMLKRQKILLPTLSIQEKISNILSAYDDLIENNNRRIKILEQMAENLYKEWFVRFRFPGHEQAEFENGMPKGWERNSISEFYRTSSGGTPSRAHEDYYADGIHPWVKTGELKDSIILDTEEYITQEAIQKTAARLHSNRSVAMAMYGVNIGMLGYFDSQMACNQACCVFVDRRNFSSRHYLFYCLKSMRDYLMLISFGAAQQNLSQDLIKKVKIIMPPDDLVKSFEEHVENVYKNIRCLLHTNKNLTKQRDMLLPRLMSGKLEV